MSTRDVVYVALFAALIAVLGLLPKINIIPAVPITAQSMGVMLAGAIAGSKRGGLAMALFVGLVAIGLPLLAGGRGGLGVFAGPSGGFLIGFIAGAFVIGHLYEKIASRNAVIDFICIAIGGIVIVYAFGIPWWSVTLNTPLLDVAKACLVFIPGDLIKVVLTVIIVGAIRKGDANLLMNR